MSHRMGPKAIGAQNVLPVVLILGICLATPPLHAATQVSRHGFTWTFDRDYETGQFVNGDWWVAGPVTVVSVSPGPRGAMRFNTTHFSQFLIGKLDNKTKTPRRGGAGGCALAESRDTPNSIIAFLLPLLLLVLALIGIKGKTRRGVMRP